MICQRAKGGLSAPLLGCAQFTPRGYLTKDESAGSTHEPVKGGPDIVGLVARGKGGAVDHQNRQAKGARGNQFGLRTAATGILGDHKVDAVRAHQCFVRSRVKRTAVKNDMVIGQGGRCLWRVYKPEQVMVLGRLGKRGQMHAPKGQKNAPCWACEGRGGRWNIGHVLPVIARRRCPGGARQGQKGCAGRLCGVQGIAADLCGERVGGVDQMGDGMLAQVAGKSVSPAKSAHAHGHRLGFGAFYPACIAERAGQACAGQFRDKACGLDRAAKDKDVVHG